MYARLQHNNAVLIPEIILPKEKSKKNKTQKEVILPEPYELKYIQLSAVNA